MSTAKPEDGPQVVIPEAALGLPAPLAGTLVDRLLSLARLQAAGIQPDLGLDDLAVARGVSRRELERLRAGGKVPPPDAMIGKLPRWRPASVRAWLDGEAGGGRP